MSFRTLAATAALVLTLAACGGSSPSETATPTTSAGTAAAPDGTPVLFDTVSGGQIDLGALEGQDTVLWFWAPW